MSLVAGAASAYPVYGDSADAFNQTREAAPRADGLRHVDTPFVISRLQSLGATTYAFLLWRSPSDYDDLANEFLPAAARAGIETWAYLVPPTEGTGFNIPPCNLDFHCWGDTLGRLARDHPSLTAILVDDFNSNAGTFTPRLVASMIGAARASAPAIQFLPVDYYPAALTDFSQPGYRGFVDGVVFPYTNLDATDAIAIQLDGICAAVRRQLGGRCLLMVYGGWTSWHRTDPTVDYVKAALAIGHEAVRHGAADGVITYRLDKAVGAPRFDAVAALYRRWQSPADGGAPTDAGLPLDLAAPSRAPGGGCAVGGRGAGAHLLLALLAIAALVRRAAA